MIKSYTAITTEVDDGVVAAKQITDALATFPLLSNTVGLVIAHPEFLASGVYTDVAKALPFPMVGATSISQCVNGTVDTYMLSLMVLTSDDCQFSCGLSEPVTADKDAVEIMRRSYDEMRSKLDSAPKLALIYAPFLDPYVRQSDYIAAISQSADKPAVFGMVANDDLRAAATPRDCAQTFYCGEHHAQRIASVLISGDFDPRFYIASVTESAVIMSRIGVITAIDDNKLLEINNIPAATFFRNVGFLLNDVKRGDKGFLSSILVLHIKDENGYDADISRIPIAIDGDSVFCGGRLVLGAVLSVAFNTKEVVLETAANLMNTIKKNHKGGTVIANSCLGRRYGLLGEPMRELELIRDMLDGDFNYTAVYVNGELCPTDVTGKAGNQEHNQTLVTCVF